MFLSSKAGLAASPIMASVCKREKELKDHCKEARMPAESPCPYKVTPAKTKALLLGSISERSSHHSKDQATNMNYGGQAYSGCSRLSFACPQLKPHFLPLFFSPWSPSSSMMLFSPQMCLFPGEKSPAEHTQRQVALFFKKCMFSFHAASGTILLSQVFFGKDRGICRHSSVLP